MTPQTKGSKTAFVDPRTGYAVLKDRHAAELKRWEKAVAKAAEAQIGAFGLPHTGDVMVRMTVRLVRPKAHYRTGRFERFLKEDAPERPGNKTSGDVDKYLRAIFDAMEAVVYENDGQVCEALVRKVYVDRFGGAAGADVAVFSLPASSAKQASIAEG